MMLMERVCGGLGGVVDGVGPARRIFPIDLQTFSIPYTGIEKVSERFRNRQRFLFPRRRVP